jgi:hypothetical protein
VGVPVLGSVAGGTTGAAMRPSVVGATTGGWTATGVTRGIATGFGGNGFTTTGGGGGVGFGASIHRTSRDACGSTAGIKDGAFGRMAMTKAARLRAMVALSATMRTGSGCAREGTARLADDMGDLLTTMWIVASHAAGEAGGSCWRGSSLCLSGIHVQ